MYRFTLTGIVRDMLIAAVDGRSVGYRDEFLDIIRAKRPGSEVTLRVIASPGAPPRDVRVVLGCLETAGELPAATQTSKPAASKAAGS